MILFDFKCPKCGHEEKDHALKDTTSQAPRCEMCEETMIKMFTGFSTPHGIRHHRKLPDNYKFAQGGANFGKL